MPPPDQDFPDASKSKIPVEMLQQLFENFPEGVFYTDMMGRINWCNKNGAAMFGYTIDEIIGLAFIELVDPDYQESVIKAWKHSMQTKETTIGGFEVKGIKKDGLPIFLYISNTILLDEGEPQGFHSLIRDITKMKQIEETLRESEIKYRALIEKSIQGILIFQGFPPRIVFANPAASNILGYTIKELLDLHPKQIQELVSSEHLGLLLERFQKLTTGKPDEIERESNHVHQPREIRVNRKDGSVRWLELFGVRIDFEGQPAVQATILDITERKMMEEALLKAEQEKAIIFDSISEHVIFQDTENKIIWANKAAAESVNLTVDEITGRYCYEIWNQSNTPCVGCPIVEARKSGENRENEMTTPDGRVWLVRGYPLLDHEGIVIGCIEVTYEITERKHAEEALRRERDRAQRYLSIAGVVFIGINRDQKVFLINRKGCEIIGYKEAEIIGKNYFDTCIPETLRKGMKDKFDRAMQGAYTLSEFVENPIITKDGHERILSWHTTVLHDDKGKISGILSSGEDITERKVAEAALQASEEKFRSLVEDTTDWVWEVDNKGCFTYSNSSVEDILGYSAGQVMRRTPWDYMLSEEIKESKIFFQESVEKKRPFRNLVNQYIHRDGGTIILEASGRPILDDQGLVLGYRGVCRDITQRMIADQILRESEARYRTLVETSPDGILLTNIDGEIILANKRAFDMMGYKTENELLGKSVYDLFYPEERSDAVEKFDSALIKGGFDFQEFLILQKDGTTFPAEIAVSILNDAEGNPTAILAVGRDITERKAAEQQLAEAKARAEFFTDLMAHDLNNINQAILSALELVLYEKDLPEPIKKRAELALEQVERSSGLIGRVKKFSRIDGTKPLLEVRDLEEAFNTAFQTVKQSFPNKEIRIDTNIHPGEFRVLADDLLIDLFFNILHNAVKFDRNDKVEIKVQVKLADDKRFFQVQIMDHGPGIPDDLKNQIFARYLQRIDEKGKGSGIGLTLVQRIVHRYGGQISVADRVKGDHTKGANFIILLPVWK